MIRDQHLDSNQGLLLTIRGKFPTIPSGTLTENTLSNLNILTISELLLKISNSSFAITEIEV